MRTALVALQCLCFIGLGVLLLRQGDVRLGTTQLLLAAVNGLIFYEA